MTPYSGYILRCMRTRYGHQLPAPRDCGESLVYATFEKAVMGDVPAIRLLFELAAGCDEALISLYEDESEG